MSDPHLRFRDLLPAHLGGWLAAADAAWCDAHARECSECAGLLARMRALQPVVAGSGGHAPVSMIEELVLAPESLTPLERELVRRHIRHCESCLADAEAIGGKQAAARLALDSAVWPRVLAGLGAAAALAILLLAVWPSKPPAPVQSTAPHPTQQPVEAAQSARESPRLVLLEGSRGAAEGVIRAAVSEPSASLRFRLPTSAIAPDDSVMIRVFTAGDALVGDTLVPAKSLSGDLTMRHLEGRWTTGDYHLFLVPGSGRDTTATRSYRFRLIPGAP